MPTYTAFTTTEGKPEAEALGAALEALDPAPSGIGVFEIEDGAGRWEVGAYFDAPPDEVALALLSAAHGAAGFAVSELPETDWVAKVRRELAPVEAGRFFVHGAHDADRVPEGAEALLIEASMAFATRHHGTTQGCLRAPDRLAGAESPPRSVLDLGCGTAVLAMAAARLWPAATVVASDIDPVAAEVAEANLAANALSGRVDVVTAAGVDHPDIAAAAPFDLIVANILKGPLLAMAGDLAALCAPGGHLILSGILADQAEDVAARYSRAGFNQGRSERIVDWVTLVMRKSP